MNDVTKTVCAVLITGIMQSVITTQTVSVEIVNMKSSVEKLDESVNERINKLDERVLDTQIKQAQYLAAN